MICFVDIGIGSKVSIPALFTILRSNATNCQVFAFHERVIGPVNEMECIQLQKSKEKTNIDESFLEAHHKFCNDQVLFITEHHITIFSQVGMFSYFHCPHWIIISSRNQRNETFADNIKARHIYFGDNTNELLHLMLKYEFPHCSINAFEGKVIVSEQSLADPYLTIVLEKGARMVLEDMEMEPNDSNKQSEKKGAFIEDFMDLVLKYKHKTIKPTIKTIAVSYDSPIVVEAQLIASLGLRNRFTQNQNDLFALQCLFFIDECLKKQDSGLSEWILATTKAQNDNILLHCYQQSKRSRLLIDCSIQSLSHLFAFLFAIQKKYPEKIALIPERAFARYVTFETCRKMKQLQCWTVTLQDFFIDNHEEFIFNGFELEDDWFFIHLIDPYKCKQFLNEKLMPNDGNTNLCLNFTFECLNYLFNIRCALGKLFDEPEKLFVIAIIMDIKLELFSLRTVRIVIENHLKRYLQLNFDKKKKRFL